MSSKGRRTRRSALGTDSDMPRIPLDREQEFWNRGLCHIAGVDEAGRGPLAGPVVAAAVMFDPGIHIPGIDDSKKLSAFTRERLYDDIMAKACSVGIAVIPPADIDRMNILQATLKGMKEAVMALSREPDHVFVDGPHHPQSSCSWTPVIDGDALIFSIAAASIVAKVTRDRIMIDLHHEYPQYGFHHHKGYGTPEHLAALRKYGPCSHHRRSFHMPQREEGYSFEQCGSGEAWRR